jgi:cation:H+ antiporter
VTVAVVAAGSVSRLAGGVLVLLLAGYICLAYWSERRRPDSEARRHEDETELLSPRPAGAIRPLLVALAALVGVVLGARLLVDASIDVAGRFGVPESVIGLTVVAVGTSLPELAVSAIAAFRGQGAVAVGNVVGSNIYNSLGILGATALAHPLSVPPEIAHFDVWFMLAVTAILLFFMMNGRTLGRVTGGVLVAAYGGYVLWIT